MHKMYLYLFVITLHSITASDVMHGDEYDEEENDGDIFQISERYILRCTRRFTPGNCDDTVINVWTFDYDVQNCTQRMGCPGTESSQCNRFKSYSYCMQCCQAINGVYMHLLSLNDSLESAKEEGDDQIFRSDERLELDSEAENQARPVFHSQEQWDRLEQLQPAASELQDKLPADLDNNKDYYDY